MRLEDILRGSVVRVPGRWGRIMRGLQGPKFGEKGNPLMAFTVCLHLVPSLMKTGVMDKSNDGARLIKTILLYQKE